MKSFAKVSLLALAALSCSYPVHRPTFPTFEPSRPPPRVTAEPGTPPNLPFPARPSDAGMAWTEGLAPPSNSEFADFVWSRYPDLKQQVLDARANPEKYSRAEHQQRVAKALEMCEYRVGEDRYQCEKDARSLELQPLQPPALSRFPLVWEFRLPGPEYGKFFKKSSLFFGHSPALKLHHTVLPDGGYFGLFAFDGTRITELTPEAPDAVAAVLKAEGQSAFGMPARTLAEFLSDAISWKGFHQPQVIDSEATILGAEACRPPFECFGGKFTVDRTELEKYRSRLEAPTATGDPKSGWTIRYVTIVGRELTAWTCRIDSAWSLRVTSETLSSHVFEAVPEYRI